MVRNTLRIAKRAVAVIRPHPVTGVSMLHTGRAGSTVLAKMLDQHPALWWDGELFEGYWRGRLPWYWRRLPPLTMLRARMRLTPQPFYGLETKHDPWSHLPNVLGLSLPEFVATLRRMGFTRWIELRRENYLRQITSGMVARAAGHHHIRADRPAEFRRVRIDVRSVRWGSTHLSLLERMETQDALSVETKRLLEGEPLLHLVYERDIESDPRVAYRKVCEFLSLPEHPVEVTLRKSNPYPIREIIENWEEVEDTLAGTKYEWMLLDRSPAAGSGASPELKSS